MASSLHLSLASVSNILALLSSVAALFLFVWVYHGLFPVLQLKIDLIDLNEHTADILLIRLAVENKSKVHAKLKEGKSRLQILEYDVSKMEKFSWLDEWVGFDEEGQERDEKPLKPKQFTPAHPVMRTTKYVEAGESIRIELLYHVSAPGVAVHCGFQAITKARRIWFLRNPTDSFTATAWKLMSVPTKDNTVKTSA